VRHPSFTWMVRQQYVARLAAVQQVSSGNPHNTWTVQRRNTVARLATIQHGSSLAMVHGSCTMHPSELICILFSAQPFWSGTHDFSLDGAHRFSALCLRVAIAILPCMSVRKGGGAEMKTALVMMCDSPPRRAVPLPRLWEGAWPAGITFTDEQGQGSEELERRDVLSPSHDYHHGGDGAARERTALVKGGFPFSDLA
jgi:hypothetical protein